MDNKAFDNQYSRSPFGFRNRFSPTTIIASVIILAIVYGVISIINGIREKENTATYTILETYEHEECRMSVEPSGSRYNLFYVSCSKNGVETKGYIETLSTVYSGPVYTVEVKDTNIFGFEKHNEEIMSQEDIDELIDDNIEIINYNK